MLPNHEFHVNVNQRDKINNSENYAKYMLFSFLRTLFHEKITFWSSQVFFCGTTHVTTLT